MADERAKRLSRLIEPMRVKPGSTVKLPHDYDPGYTAGWLDKKEGNKDLEASVELLAEYQQRLAAQGTWGVLVVLQGLDASGKDGTIRHVMSGVNPQGVIVHSFKTPSSEELGHDFLWRCGLRLPSRGEIGIFNRSYYEEVLVVRVHPEMLDRQGLPDSVRKGDLFRRRFEEINHWERYLVDNGFRVVKLFLNISREEQRKRFLKRVDLPEKNWKFSPSDVEERGSWQKYQKAYSEMLTHTSTKWAPWHVIPADHKWFARLGVGSVLAHTLIELDPHYPLVETDTKEALLEVKRQLEAEAPKGAAADPFEYQHGRVS